MRIDIENLVRESGKPHRIIASAANCTEATLNRILKGRVNTCKVDTLEAIAAALDTRSNWSRRGIIVVEILRATELGLPGS